MKEKVRNNEINVFDSISLDSLNNEELKMVKGGSDDTSSYHHPKDSYIETN